MADEKGQGKVKILGDNLLLKILALVGVGLIASVLFFGVELTIPSIVWALVRLTAGAILLILIIKGLESIIPSKDISPSKRFRDKVVKLAKESKPFNVNKLYLRGEDMRVYSYWGKVKGLLFLPYLVGEEDLDENGNYQYENKIDKNGKSLLDENTKKKIMIIKRKPLDNYQGDWVIVVKRGFWIFGEESIVRASKEFVSDIGESVWIKTPNCVPIGEYHYPCQQFQKDIIRIKVQHRSEVLVEVYEEFLDLLATTTQMALKIDPIYQKKLQADTESVSQENSGVLTRDQS